MNRWALISCPFGAQRGCEVAPHRQSYFQHQGPMPTHYGRLAGKTSAVSWRDRARQRHDGPNGWRRRGPCALVSVTAGGTRPAGIYSRWRSSLPEGAFRFNHPPRRQNRRCGRSPTEPWYYAGWSFRLPGGAVYGKGSAMRNRVISCVVGVIASLTVGFGRATVWRDANGKRGDCTQKRKRIRHSCLHERDSCTPHSNCLCRLPKNLHGNSPRRVIT
jgi:hypothetical protein